jgi:superfamily II DNA or RNA helicase
MIRGDLHRCLIVSPGNLVEQWQDELRQRFHLVFEILTNDRIEASASGNPFTEMPLCIARLDKLSRDERAREKLQQTEWDLVIVDEAHKMSATFFSGEVKYTKRYQLGQMLGGLTRHLVLLTATPHNGKEEDFQLFLALLDQDRFEGRFRDGVHKVDVSDIMRHLVKEQLYKFDGTPLFPERLAYTANYQLSSLETELYRAVTTYVRQQFNRADALQNNGRKGTIGFALTTLQRRLASSPEAIYQSLRRRRERLQQRLQEAKQAKPQSDRQAPIELFQQLPLLEMDDLDDLDDAPTAEVEEIEERVVDQASAARTIAELEVEIARLTELEQLAYRVRTQGSDRKWEELASLLQNNAEMFDAEGHRRKLVIFTEHRDTLNYLEERIRTMLGQVEAVVTIHGGLNREVRMRLKGEHIHDPASFARETAETERRAMQAVMEAERHLGYQPRDVSMDKCGYDIESRDLRTGKLRFLEVKGRVQGARDVIVTKNEILTALNKPEDFILAVVFVDGEKTKTYYISQPFQKEPDFDATSVTYNLANLLKKAQAGPW